MIEAASSHSTVVLSNARTAIDRRLASFVDAPSAIAEDSHLQVSQQTVEAEAITAGMLDGLPDRCKQCLALVMRNLVIEANRENMPLHTALEKAAARKRLALEAHKANGDNPPGRTVLCNMGRLVLGPADA